MTNQNNDGWRNYIYSLFQEQNNLINLQRFQSAATQWPIPSSPLLHAASSAFGADSLDGQTVDVHREHPEVAADPGSVEDNKQLFRLLLFPDELSMDVEDTAASVFLYT